MDDFRPNDIFASTVGLLEASKEQVANALGVEVGSPQVDTIFRLTWGWPYAVGKSIERGLHQLSYSSIKNPWEFAVKQCEVEFIRTILRQLPVGQQAALKLLANYDVFDMKFAERFCAVTHDYQALLRNENLPFLTREVEGGGTFSVHPLVRAVLVMSQTKEGHVDTEKINEKAARFFLQHEDLKQAIVYTIRSQRRYLLEEILRKKQNLAVWFEFTPTEHRDLLDMVPVSWIQEYPDLRVASLLLDIRNGALLSEKNEQFLEDCQQGLSEGPNSNLQANIETLKLWSDEYCTRPDYQKRLSTIERRLYPASAPAQLLARQYATIAIGHLQQADIAKSMYYSHCAMAWARACQDKFVVQKLLCVQAFFHCELSNHDEAKKLLCKADLIETNEEGGQSGIKIMIAFLKQETQTEFGDPVAALTKLVSMRGWDMIPTAIATAILTRLARCSCRGPIRQSVTSMFNKLCARYAASGNERLVRICSAASNYHTLLSITSSGTFVHEAPLVSSFLAEGFDKQATVCWQEMELYALLDVKILFVCEKFPDALHAARSFIEQAKSRKMCLSETRMRLILIQILVQTGKGKEAWSELKKTVCDLPLQRLAIEVGNEIEDFLCLLKDHGCENDRKLNALKSYFQNRYEEQNNNLSFREMQILGYLQDDCSDKVIARNLDITHHTVRYHLKKIYRKLKVHSRKEARNYALQHNS